jgi:hypothetical protein
MAARPDIAAAFAGRNALRREASDECQDHRQSARWPQGRRYMDGKVPGTCGSRTQPVDQGRRWRPRAGALPCRLRPGAGNATLRSRGLWTENGPRRPAPRAAATSQPDRDDAKRTTLRFHAGLKHPSSGIWPAMVGLVTRGSDDTPLAIHRTILTRNGGKAPVNPQKTMLGPCRGGAVRLGLPGDVLMVSERYWKAPRLQQQGGSP